MSRASNVKFDESLVSITKKNCFAVELKGRFLGMFTQEELLLLYRAIARKLHVGPFKTVVMRVASKYGISEADIFGRSKKDIHVWPRHIATYLCIQLLPKANPYSVGALFGRHQGNARHSTLTVKNRMETEPAFRAEIEGLVTSIREEINPDGIGGLEPQCRPKVFDH